jgi:predicted dehydrogenase
VRFAVLGLGSAGRRHATDLLELGHDVTAFDPLGVSLDGVHAAPSLEQAVVAADAVVVASPNAMHAAQAAAALEAGCHLLVEKPLATDPADARRIVELAGRTGVTCGVAMNLRFHPALLELRRLIQAGALGEVHLAQASYGNDLRRWRPTSDYRTSYSARSDLGGGIVLDAIHELDYMLWLLGPVTSVAAEVDHLSTLEIDVEDAAVVVARFAAGTVATVDLNFLEPVPRRQCLFVGSEAVAECNLLTGTLTLRPGTGDAQVIEAHLDAREGYRAELRDFVAAIETGAQPRCPLADGAAAVAFADAIKESARLGSRVLLG